MDRQQRELGLKGVAHGASLPLRRFERDHHVAQFQGRSLRPHKAITFQSGKGKHVCGAIDASELPVQFLNGRIIY